MALPAAGIAAAGTALAAYLDAKFHIRNDLRLGSRMLNTMRAMRFMDRKAKENKILLYNIFEDRASTPEGNNIFLWFEGREWTYRQFFEALQPIGNWLLKELDIQKDEIVALDGPNSPEHLLITFALEGIGAAPAFINCNLTGPSLVHCVKVSGARYILADKDIQHLVSPAEKDLTGAGAQTVYYSPEILATMEDKTLLPAARRSGLDIMGFSNLIYTSGTTGMPKGTVGTRGKQLSLIRPGALDVLNLKPEVRMYTCLPLYHGAAHGLCLLPTIGFGSTICLSRKFSHRTFWPEVHASKAHIIQYVGELCRYLLNARPSALDKSHSVRIVWGNGMRPDVWEPFRERFGIETIAELYAATDGIGFSAIGNRGDFSSGAIGVRGPLWHLLNGMFEKRVRIDPDTQEIMRGKDGFAIQAKTGEMGETISRMDPSNPDRMTPTYHKNHTAAVKRRVRDVFKKGDIWFRSGDLMRLDADGRLYFVDRLGDTYRWHSENVSTNEVSDMVSEFPQVLECNVYGVLVPNADGRAGCAAIVPRDGVVEDMIDWKGLAEHCLWRLPRYAVPIFMRVTKKLEYTGTMKLQKSRLRTEGIELDVIEKAAKEKSDPGDSMYWLPPGQREYVPFRRKDLEQLRGASVRL